MTIEIPLSQGRVALIDDQDAAAVGRFNWFLHTCGSGANTLYYAIGNLPRQGKKRGAIKMHRLIMDAPSGISVDHINHNGIDNRRCNLRLATGFQNSANMRPQASRYGYTGVTSHPCVGGARYYGRLYVRGKWFFTKVCATPAEAAWLRDDLAIEHCGEFARLNFSDGDLTPPLLEGAS